MLSVLIILGLSYLAATAQQCTLEFEPGVTEWEVPAGITAINILIAGGAGGDGGNGGDGDNGTGGTGGTGGNGGFGMQFAGTSIPVTPGDILQIIVGAAGEDGANGASGGTDGGGDAGGGGGGGNVSAILNLTQGTAIAIAPGGGGGGGGGGAGTINDGGGGGGGGSAGGNNLIPVGSLNLVIAEPGEAANPGTSTMGGGGAAGMKGSGIGGVGGFTPRAGPTASGPGGGGGAGSGASGGGGYIPQPGSPSSPSAPGAPAGAGGAGGAGGPGATYPFLLGVADGDPIPNSTQKEDDGQIVISFSGECPMEEVPAMPKPYLVLFIIGLLLVGGFAIKRLKIN